MPQITNAQLFAIVTRLEDRVKKLEDQVNAQEGSIKGVNQRLDTIDSGIRSARFVMAALGAVVSPVITAVIVLIIQKFVGG